MAERASRGVPERGRANLTHEGIQAPHHSRVSERRHAEAHCHASSDSREHERVLQEQSPSREGLDRRQQPWLAKLGHR